MKIFYLFVTLLLATLVGSSAAQNNPEDAILGRWMTEKNSLEVEIYKQNNSFKARILWFDDSDDKSRPMDSRVDDRNPDESLRTRKWIGMDVLRDLRYDADEKEWVDGKVYVAKNGKEWDSIAWMPDDNSLKVKGYWLFKFLGQTLVFKRVTQ